MFDFHKDKIRYFNWQHYISRDYIVPFISDYISLEGTSLRVLEVGCAEAGVLKAFTDKGHTCVGVELQDSRVVIAKEFMKEELANKKISFITKNIYDIDPQVDFEGGFDVIILKDVIEHIHDQDKFIGKLSDFLNKDGVVFFGFPPWKMPFGGHQQLFANKYLSKIPYTHLLPYSWYKKLMELFKESDTKVANLLEIKDTGISTKKFEKIVAKEKYQILKKQFFLFNPIYQYKFGLKPRKQFGFISALFCRDVFTTCAYYLIKKK